MINPKQMKTLGLTLIILSTLGMLFSLTSIITIFAIKPGLQTATLGALDIFSATLETTNDGIGVIDSALYTSNSNLDVVYTSLETLGTTLMDVSTSLDTTATLVGDNFRNTIIETQVSLSSASSSAKIIDDTLGIIAKIPFIGADYKPEVPLHISLGNVADRLDELPDTLETMELNLSDSSGGLSDFAKDLSLLTENISNFSKDLTDAQDVLADYETTLVKAIDRTASLKQNLGKVFLGLSLFLSGMLLWLGVAQFTVLLQGLAFWRNDEKVVTLADLERENTQSTTHQVEKENS